MQSLLPLVGLAIFLVIAMRFAAARCDLIRIERHVAKLGGHVLDSRWFPVGPESFGDDSACIYAVRYLGLRRQRTRGPLPDQHLDLLGSIH